MSLWLVLLAIYVAVTLVLIGAFVMEEMSFKNPDYVMAIVAPFFWPFLVGFAVFKRWVEHRRENR